MARFCDKCGINLVFGTDRNTGIGYCKSHQYLRTDLPKKSITQRAIDKHKLNPTKTPQKQPRFQRTIQIPTEKDIIEISGVSDLNSGIVKDMDTFWKYAEQVIAKNPYCWECSEYISKSDYRNSTGHIFPKSLFPSVADNIYNFVVVGNRCGCHHKTHTLATFSQMSIFPVAIQRYLKFGHLIIENHKHLDLFLDYANQII